MRDLFNKVCWVHLASIYVVSGVQIYYPYTNWRRQLTQTFTRNAIKFSTILNPVRTSGPTRVNGIVSADLLILFGKVMLNYAQCTWEILSTWGRFS